MERLLLLLLPPATGSPLEPPSSFPLLLPLIVFALTSSERNARVGVPWDWRTLLLRWERGLRADRALAGFAELAELAELVELAELAELAELPGVACSDLLATFLSLPPRQRS